MLHLFLTPSPLLVGGEVLVGMSLPMFVEVVIVAFGDRIKLSGRRGAVPRVSYKSAEVPRIVRTTTRPIT
jgi:hypothetical protein